jgi:UTP:GlnB (protein PII) uridylyltransferase
MLESESTGYQMREISPLPLYSVEPHLKEGPGSLRDLHRARWIFKLLLKTNDSDLYRALIDRTVMPPRQINEIHSGR